MAYTTVARSGKALILVAVLAVPTAFLLWQQVRAPGERFMTGTGHLASIGGRLPVWDATIGLVTDHLALGSGFGSFGHAFFQYQPAATSQYRWNYAHSDWLQSGADGGIIATASLLVLSVMAFRRRPTPTAVSCAVAAGLVAIVLHSTVDFVLRIPANAVLVACLVGMSSTDVYGGPRRLHPFGER